MASAKKRPSWYHPQRWEVLSGPCSRWNRVFPGLNSETLTTCTLARGLSFGMDCSQTSSVNCDAKAALRHVPCWSQKLLLAMRHSFIEAAPNSGPRHTMMAAEEK